MFKVCKEHGRRLIKVVDYCKSHYLGTQWGFLFNISPTPQPKAFCGKPAVLPGSHGSAGISLSAEALKDLCVPVRMQNK